MGGDLNSFGDIKSFRNCQFSNFLARVFYGLSCKDRYYRSLHSVRFAETALDLRTTNMALTKLIYHAGIQEFSSRGLGATNSCYKHVFVTPTYLH